MKAIILGLIKKVYALGPTTLVVKTEQEGNRVVTTAYHDRTSLLWGVRDRQGNPDDQTAMKLVNMQKDIAVDELLTIVQEYLKSQDLYDDYQKADVRRRLGSTDKKLKWCLRVLFRLNVIEPYEVMTLSGVEGDEVEYGAQRKIENEEAGEDLGDI